LRPDLVGGRTASLAVRRDQDRGDAGASLACLALRCAPALAPGCAMVLMIDNYDSFTWNIVQYLGELGEEVEVVRNDAIDVAGIRARAPSHVVISPGPCTPNEAGVSLAVVAQLAGEIPVLGVCLGHQAIGQAFGGKVVRARSIMHGKTSPVRHTGAGVFAGLPDPFQATRYHSLVVERASLPDCLEITAWATARWRSRGCSSIPSRS
jgi:anthranilate synthase component 2